ncbi:MAG: hypothetical protein AAF456_11670 [Planctomycetota bacterium]
MRKAYQRLDSARYWLPEAKKEYRRFRAAQQLRAIVFSTKVLAYTAVFTGILWAFLSGTVDGFDVTAAVNEASGVGNSIYADIQRAFWQY